MNRSLRALVALALCASGARAEAQAKPATPASPASPATPQAPVHVAPNAPRDRPLNWSEVTSRDDFYRFLEPCRLRAAEELPGVKRRFQAGLPPRHSLFVVTRLRDSRGAVEQVFVVVDSLAGDRVLGRVWSDIASVQGYRLGQPLALPDSAIVDWMISRPDGTEEGNRMGRIMDELQEKGAVPRDVCSRP